MGSSLSVLDENKTNFIKAITQKVLMVFAAIYRKQYSLAFLSNVHNELVQRKPENTQLLQQKSPLQEADIIYGDNVLFYDESRKWRERFVVVRGGYILEFYESYESFMKNISPVYKLQPTGGAIFISEDKYMEIVDKCFPETDNLKEDFAPPRAAMPGQFPVYLHLPYQKDYYFCFQEQAKQIDFISYLSDCVRHQNQDFVKKKTYEVEAFIKAIQFYREERGHYEPWDMLMGNDVQVLSNVIMEDVLPFLENELLARSKAKKMERRRIWFMAVEAAYNLVQETLTEGMTALNEECREAAKKQSALMTSNMDQIMSSQTFLEGKLRAKVAEPASEYCREHVEPFLSAMLEEIMQPVSLGFKEARHLSERMMEQMCQNYQKGTTSENLPQALAEKAGPHPGNLQICYEKVSGLKDNIQQLQQSFTYPHWKGLEHSIQIDIQQLVENVVYTFEQLLNQASKETELADIMMKAKNRVLKQYDYDSSTLRKSIFQDTLLSVTLPRVKAHLAPTMKQELPGFEEFIFADYVNFINVENVYEDILQQILEKDISKVVNDAASMKKYNLFTESRHNFSVSSMFHKPESSSDALEMPASSSLNCSPTQTRVTAEDVLTPRKESNNNDVKLEVTALEQVKALEQFTQASECAPEDGQQTEATETLQDPIINATDNKNETIQVHAELEECAVTQRLNQENENKLEPHTEDVDPANSIITNSTVLPCSTLTEPVLKSIPNQESSIPSISDGEDAVSQEKVLLNETTTRKETESCALLSSSLVLVSALVEPQCFSESALPPAADEGKCDDIKDSEVLLHEIRSEGPLNEGREDKTAEDFSDDSSWVTEDEEEVIYNSDDDEALEIGACPEPENTKKPIVGKCEALLDADAVTDPVTAATRAPDCIKEIRNLVFEVIEVEETVQDHPENED